VIWHCNTAMLVASEPTRSNACPMLKVVNLSKSYRSAQETVHVLRGVDLTVARGESVALTGESGSGKSTLLHLIAGLDERVSPDWRMRVAPRCGGRGSV